VLPEHALRAALAAAQEQLLASLVAGAPPPAGFDPQRLAATAAGLHAKRRRSAARAWPVLAAALGDDFEPLFRRFAMTAQRGSALEDGLAFADWLAGMGRLPQRGAAERLGVLLRHRRTEGGLIPRQGFALRLARLGRAAWLIAIRFPGGRVWWWRWPR
jgi:hypothetical protein